MRLITREIDYAIRALSFMAQNNHNSNVITVSELVRKLKTPRPFLRKILQILNKKGLLHSSKGTGGGFRLVRSPGEISLNDLVTIFHGRPKFNKCVFNKKICPDIRTCPLKKKIENIEQYVMTELKAITLASLLPKAKNEKRGHYARISQ
ncbi:MAG: Rrf2 family transcriptional regulator [Planctomycetota bacterium]